MKPQDFIDMLKACTEEEKRIISLTLWETLGLSEVLSVDESHIEDMENGLSDLRHDIRRLENTVEDLQNSID